MEEESEMMPAEGKLHDILGLKDLQNVLVDYQSHL